MAQKLLLSDGMFISNISTIRGPSLLEGYGGKVSKDKGREFSLMLDSLKGTHDLQSASKIDQPYIEFRRSMVSRTIKPEPQKPLALQIKAYKEDQLLSNPGGDFIFLDKSPGKVINPHYDHSNFLKRIGKDIDDAAQNFINASKNLLGGAEFLYVDQGGNLKKANKTGLINHIKNFSQDMFSGVTFGFYTPTPDKQPQGFFGRVGHFFRKVIGEALIGDIAIGVSKTALNIAEDVAFGTLNLIEVVPDATIGNFRKGREITTTVFDNGQVVLDYLTDILPLGEASERIQAIGSTDKGIKNLPLIYNLSTPEKGLKDPRWQTVRNTPFRKIIESLGTLFSSIIFRPFQITKFINPWDK
jgi:hypothetical protein